MKNIIIGIHGLAPKPPAEILQDWWHTSILEGLNLNHDTAPDVPFELAYWADIRNQTVPISSLDEHYEKANPPLSRFNPGLKDKIKAKLKKKFGNAHEKAKIIPGLGKAAEELLNIKFDDLEAYYEEDHIRRAMRDRLASAVRKHQGKRILVIAHSMGSIIAHDALRLLEAENENKVEHLITVGSPLGLPIVTNKIEDEFGKPLFTPKNVGRWTNIADPDDKVALDHDLTNEFGPHNGVQVDDVLVNNEYRNNEGKKNQHKSYGYLRAPEMSDAILEFLQAG